MDFSSLPLTLEATVEAKHLDQLDHMNVMWYMHFFDAATWNWYESFDFGKDYHAHSGFGSFALESHIRYIAELRVGEQVKLHTRMLGRNAKLFHYIHFMQRARDGELSATCELLGVHVDMATRRSAPMPERIGAHFDKLLAAHSQLEWEAPLSGSIRIQQ
ncbi:MAG: thioesterase family protein [Anaerolineales bacterium]